MGKPNHTLEFRIAVMKFYLSGQGGMKRTAAHFGIHKSTASHWVASWQMHGIDGITWKISGYSPAFKLEVVRAIHKEHLSFREAAVRFNISDNKVVKRWMDVFESAGETGLQSRRHIKVRAEKIPEQTTRPPDSVSRPAEDLSHDELLAELRYLRAEVDHLKKRKALAQQNRKQK